MMIAMLVISQPAWLAAALVAACAGAVLARVAYAGDVLVRAAGRGARRTAAAIRLALAAAGSAAVGALLVQAGNGAPHVVLAALALFGGVWLARELYRRDTGVGRGRRAGLAALRVCAWAVLLVVLGRPVVEQVILAWDKPVLAVLLDDSASMALSDRPAAPASARSRAQRVNEQLGKSKEAIRRVRELYDVRLRRVGARPEAAAEWAIVPEAPLTAIAAALRDARELRSTRGRPPVAVLLISDGAENAADSAAVRQAGDDLGSQKTALLAIGVGPEAGQTPLVELEPLVVPPRVAVRDVLHVTVAGRVQGCRGGAVRVAVLWDDDTAASASVSIDYESQQIAPAFDVPPPGPGAHRLSVSVALPAALGGQRFTTATIVDVVSDRVRVLYIEQAPRTESGFVTRAWRGDDALEVTTQYLFEEDVLAKAAREDAQPWSGYDVVVLGHVRGRMAARVVEGLARAVTERGAGLLLAGGRDLLGRDEYADTPLADVCPVQFGGRIVGRTDQPRFVPTEAGLRHPVLQGVVGGGDTNGGASARAVWERLPALGGAALLGEPKPAALVLAADQAGRALLVAQEVGRGRSLAAGWESTWPWVLGADEGGEIHRRFWRQMVVWLANRRPRAWVVPDQAEYSVATLAAGERRVRVRAGVAALDAVVPAVSRDALQGTLTLRRADGTDSQAAPAAVVLTRAGDEWSAELPDPATKAPQLPPGTYLLEFAARVADERAAAATGITAEDLTARARFVVVAEDLETRPPNADLALLRVAAERTAACGGSYRDVAGLGEALKELAAQDRRERVETPTRYDLVAADPWGLWLWLVLAVGGEWALRKRSGLP